MRNNVKRIATLCLLVLLAVCALALTACDGGDEDDTPEVTYTVYCFPADGGAATEKTVSKQTGNSVGKPTMPGKKFLGYYTAEGAQIFNAEGKQVDGFIIDKNITVYAKFEDITYTLQFDAGEGTLAAAEATRAVTQGAALGTLPTPAPAAANLQFDGWYNKELTVAYSTGAAPLTAQFDITAHQPNGTTVTLYAKYSVKKVTVTLDYNDGSFKLDTLTLDYGTAADALAAYKTVDEENKREIVGFSTSRYELTEPSTPFYEDVTLYAIWQSYKHVTLVYGEGDERIAKVYDGGVQGATLPEAEKPGYSFDGWYPTAALSGNPVTYISFSALADRYYAKFTVTDYTLTFQTGGDEVVEPMHYFYGDTTILPILTRTGHELLGWSTESDGAGTPFVSIPADLYGDYTLYAVWQKKSYAVTLDPCGGVASSTLEIVSYQSSYTFPIAVREGYEFLGWFDGKGEDATAMTNAKGAGLAAWATDGGATLYARWRICTYRVIYQTNGGTSVSAQTYSHGDLLELPAAPAKSGMIFAGWFNSEGAVEYSYGMAVTDHMTLYAKWVEGIALSTPADLEKLRNDPAGVYYLANDINMNNQTHTPIPAFSGKLYGQGHVIKNLIISGDTDKLGFFGENSGTVRDVTFEGVSLNYNRTAAWCAAAVIAAHNLGTGELINCTVRNSQISFTHTATEKATWNCFVAGIAGANNGTVLQCTAELTVTGTSRGYPSVNWEPHYTSSAKVGGIAGENYGGTVRFCTATVNIEVTGAALDDNQKDWYQSCLYGGAASFLGGLVGQNINGVIETSTVTSGSRVVANQTHDGIYNIQIGAQVGGLVGYNTGTINACYLTGVTVSSAGWVEGRESHYNSYVGGFIGNNHGKIENCHASASVTCTAAYHDVGGFVGFNGGIINNCYANSTATNGSAGTCFQFVGWNGETGSVTGCFSHGAFGGSSGSIFNCFNIGTASDAHATPVTQEEAYTDTFLWNTLYWDESVWVITTDENEAVLPLLKWQQ